MKSLFKNQINFIINQTNNTFVFINKKAIK